VDPARPGRTAASLARELEPTETTIRNWVAQVDRDAGVRRDGLTTDERMELNQLGGENCTLREEGGIFIYSSVVRAGGQCDTTEVFGYMKTQEDRHSTAAMSRLLEVSRNGSDASADRPLSRRVQEDFQLGRSIQNIPEQSRGVSRRKWTTTTVRDRSAVVAPDLVKRGFRAQGPNQLWVALITDVPTWPRFLSVAVVLDAWSRRVVGWVFVMHLRVELVLAALAARGGGGAQRLEGVARRAGPHESRAQPDADSLPTRVPWADRGKASAIERSLIQLVQKQR